MPQKSAHIPPNAIADNQLGLSDLRLRLNFLETENDKLLKQIEKIRTKIDKLQGSIEELSIEFTQRTAPLRHKVSEIDNQIHNLFAEIFTGRKLGKKSRQALARLYQKLQTDGVISPRYNPAYEPDNLVDNNKNKSSGHAQNQDLEDDWEEDKHHQSNQDFATDIDKPSREELKKIRQLFLQLAENFHPDKVTDAEQKEYCTEVMKQINQAYQNADLAQLLAIAKKQAIGEPIDLDNSDDLLRRCAKVEAENEILKAQFGDLKLQLKLTKNTPQGQITAHVKKVSKYGADPIGVALKEMEVQIKVIKHLHQFVLDFRDRRISVQEFLEVPNQLIEQRLVEEEVLEFLY